MTPPTANTVPPGGVEPPASPSPVSAQTDLSITVTPSPGAQPIMYRLIVDDGVPGAGSTVPDPPAAVAALERFGAGVFFPVPGPPRQCIDVYGGPQVAVVAGVFQGRPVEAVFKRTDSCETARWRALAPLFGAVAGGTGAT